jgi:ACS family hexuronate transporter-like MFS transporter
MSSTKAAPVPTSMDDRVAALGWKIWLPCLGQALCSFLSFLHRTTLAVLLPAILKETGLSLAEYGSVVSFFFLAYTISNPLWGSILDYVGLRVGMLMAVAFWSGASASHALMGSFLGFAAARALLGLGEGATFPGGLRTAVESLPAKLRGRGTALSFSGGTLGAILTSFIVLRLSAAYGWRTAFVLVSALGILWLVYWAAVARPPYLPKEEQQVRKKLGWPNPLEVRFWSLVFGYALTCMSAGPILNIFPAYFNRALGVAQDTQLWVAVNALPPFFWGVGYFFWGWIVDKFAADNPRPATLMILLTVLSLSFGFAPMAESVGVAVALESLSTFLAGGFQMVALRASSFRYPREKIALMTGIAAGSFALVNTIVSPIIGRMFDQKAWGEAFWLVAVLPVIGTSVWLFLSARKTAMLDPRIVFGILGLALATWLKFLLRPQAALAMPLIVGGIIGLAVGLLIWIRKPAFMQNPV